MTTSATAAPETPAKEKRKFRKTSDLNSDLAKPAPLPEIGEQGEGRQSPILQAEERLKQEYLEALAFGEQRLKIMIQQSPEENAPACTDLISNNGDWAEIWFAGRWVKWGYLPTGVEFWTKRKYVQELARSKKTSVQHGFEMPDGQPPRNVLRRTTRLTFMFQVVEDSCPDKGKAAAWLRGLLASQS